MEAWREVLYSCCLFYLLSSATKDRPGKGNCTNAADAQWKGIQDSLRFWIPRRRLRIPCTGFRILWPGELGFWIPIVRGITDSLRFIPDSKAQDIFRIPQANISLAWENSRHLATLPLVFPPNDVRETSAEIPYWCRVTTQIWVVVLIGRAAWEICRFNESGALPRTR